MYALLAVLRLCLVAGGGVGTQKNQEMFCHHGILKQTLQLAFNRSTELQIKAEVRRSWKIMNCYIMTIHRHWQHVQT
jgi:hypothetical protein